jgi:general secretion pathway protein E
MANLSKEKVASKNDEFDSRQSVELSAFKPLGGGDKVPQLKIDLELSDQIWGYLRKQGYKVTEQARLIGKSGVEHTFDMLAQRDDGFISYTMAICIAVGGDKEAEVQTIFNFANKAYDTGITDRVLIAVPDISPEAKQLAGKQRIKVIEAEKMGALLDNKPVAQLKPGEPLKFETRAEMAKCLLSRGYQVEEKAKVKSRSGVEYSFDILAYVDMDGANHSLGIDFLSADKEVGLDQVSLFDTKAYEVGIDDKVIVVSPALSLEAKQFAKHQRIRVFEVAAKPASRDSTSVEEATKPDSAKVKTKQLRQMVQAEALQMIPEVMARRYNAVPLTLSGNTLKVAMADPTDIFALEAFSAQSKKRIQPIGASAKEVREAIDFNYKGHSEIEKQIAHISIPADALDERLAIDAAIDAPLAQALNLIVEEAVRAHSSDIHIEPEEDRVRVRYRIDGTLQDMMSLPLTVHRAVISRIKILADMNIADHHRPQDGQFSTKAKGREIDVRVATGPTVFGEMAVLRLLDKARATLGLSELGFLPDSQAKYESLLKVPYGMLLISGPTGAGKTTTLYASINSLDTMGRNIITIEDPAEYRFKDINQIQVNAQAGITFARGLRSILRLDPDVIMVGEIRDTETTQIAVQSALTGHLMLSSIHASDAAGVLTRLIDLGVEPFLIASAVIGVVAQRMVRRICPDCSHPIEAPLVERIAYQREMGEEKAEFLYGTGCATCAYTGYVGRTGIFEILLMSDGIRALVTNQANSSEIRSLAFKEGMRSMMSDGMRKVQSGITTPSEVLRSAYSPDLRPEVK